MSWFNMFSSGRRAVQQARERERNSRLTKLEDQLTNLEQRNAKLREHVAALERNAELRAQVEKKDL